MTKETLYQLHAYLLTATKLAQQYPELDKVWDNIENALYELDQVDVTEEAA